MPAPSSAAFVLTLVGLPGVGRVTTHRLLQHFSSYADLVRYPREQVLTRLKGAPKADQLVATLFDRDAMRERLDAAQDDVDALGQKRVQLLTPLDDRWPRGVDDLPLNQRPVALYAYGNVDVLRRPLVALFGRPPVSDDGFEHAQAVLHYLIERNVIPVVGASSGFDVVMHKRASGAQHPSVAVAACGLGRVDNPVRPTLTAAVRSAGLLLSPFPMTHGPFEHDDKERALVMAALATASVFTEPSDGTPEAAALAWAHAARRPVFGIAKADERLADGVHPLDERTDFDWIGAALGVTSHES